jgi:hypothetical protein
MKINYIIIVSFCYYNHNGLVGNEECTSSTLWSNGTFPCFYGSHSDFSPEREFGLVQCANTYQVIAYGCLEGLFKVFYTCVTKSGLYF